MEHTEGKREVKIIGNEVCIVADNKLIAIISVKPDATHLYKPAEMEANAYRLCRCDNNFDNLLDACREAKAFIVMLSEDKQIKCKPFYDLSVYEKLQMVISEAEKE
jgi:hypothetical protein